MLVDETLGTSSADDGSLLIGQIRNPEGLQTAFRKILHGVAVENAVLLVFSKEIKGRIGVFQNRIITGATLEPSGDTGLEAAQTILSVNHGMYGFRSALGDEVRELSQSLTIRLEELLQKGQLAGLLPATPTTPSDESQPETAPTNAESESSIITDPGDIDPAYLKWLQAEREKVMLDIESTMQKATQVNAASADGQTEAQAAEAISDLSLVKEMLQSEQNRADRWQGLDAIPTPTVVSQSAYAGVDRRTAHPGEQFLPAEGERRSRPMPLPPSTKITSADSLKTSGRYHRMATGDDPTAPVVATECAELSDIVKRRQTRLVLASLAVMLACGSIAYFFHSYEITSAFNDANKFFAKKEYLQAAIVTQQALKKDPTNARLHLQLGLAFAKLKRLDNAISEFKTCLKLGGPRLPSLLGLAGAFCEKKEYDKAIAECKVILLKYPDNTEAILLLSAAHEHQSQPEQAVAICTKGLEKVKDADARHRLFIERGFAYARLLKQKEAEADFTAAVALKPSVLTYLARADLFRKNQKYAEATDDYTRAIWLEPENYIPYVGRGISHMKQQHDEEALQDFGKALALEKHCMEAFIQRGSLYLSQGAYRLAANDLEDAIKLNPSLAESQQKLDLANKYLRREKSATQSENYSLTTKFTMPTDPDQLLQVGSKYLSDGELDHAILCFAAAVKKNPNSAASRQYLAHALFDAGDAAGAALNFEALNTINGIDPKDVVPMASSLARSGKRNRAIQVLETWLRQTPQATIYRCELANLYFAAQLPAMAKQVILSGLALPNASIADKQQLQDLLASFARPTENGVNSTTPAPENETVPKHVSRQ